MRKNNLLLSLVIFFYVTPCNIRAQIQIGSIKGTVADHTGARMPHPTVSLDSPVTGFHSTAATGEDGEYIFNNVPFGAYILRVGATGFQPSAQGVSVRSNIPVVIDFKLSVAGASESVNVRAAESLVRSDSASTETTVDESFIRHQPGAARGRQLQIVVATTPGTLRQ